MTSLVDEELVLLTSYFNLSNGRRQDTADTFRVDPSLPSSTSPSGAVALYVVTEASGGSRMGSRARRLAADTIAREYPAHGHESPAKRLKAAIHTAHQEVRREFDGHVAVGISVIAVEHNDVYLAQVAPAQVYVLHDGNLHSNSPDPGIGAPFARAVGGTRTPHVVLARDEIAEGDVLAICSSWFARVADQEEVRRCFELGTADDISAGLFDLCERSAAHDATAIVIEAVREADLHGAVEDMEDPGSFLEQVDMAVRALANVGRGIVTELKPPPDERVREDGGPRSHAAAASAGLSEPLLPGERPAGGPDDDLVDDQRPGRERRQGRFWSGTARRRPRMDNPAPGETTHPSVDRETGLPSWEDDPFATRETPAVATPEPPPESQVADPWNPERTMTYDLGDLQGSTPVRPPDGRARRRDQATEETPAIPPEAWAEEFDTESAEAPWADIPDAPEPPSSDAGDEAPAEHEPPSESVSRAARPRRPFRSEREERVEPVEDMPSDTRTQAEIDAVNSRLHGDLEMDEVIPPVQGYADSSIEPSRIYATSKDIQAVNRRARRFGGMGRNEDSSHGARVVRPAQDLDLRRPVSRPAPNAVIWFVVAAISLFAVAAGVIAIRNLTTRQPVVNPYPARVQRDLRLAQQAKGFQQQQHYLVLARQNLALARRNGTPKARIRRLQRLIAAASDTVYRITRVAAPVVVGKFQNPTEIATGATNLYVLDAGKGAVYSVQQNSTAAPTQIVSAGEVDNGTTIGKLTQLATSGDTALVLDQNNVLVRDSSGAKTATFLTKPSPTLQVAGMINSGPDVYLLDPAASQVWRYPNAVAGYGPAPVGFFQPGGPSLSKAVSFTMDDTAIYILQSDRTVLKYDVQGRRQAFTLSLRVPLANPVSIFTDVGLNSLWIADPGAGRIVQIDKTGNYIRSYASSNAAMALKELKGIAVQPDGKTLYTLAGSQVFRFDVKP